MGAVMNRPTYFCNECFYWWKPGGFILHHNKNCPECSSPDIVKKNLSYDEQAKIADIRDYKRRNKAAPNQFPMTSVIEEEIIEELTAPPLKAAPIIPPLDEAAFIAETQKKIQSLRQKA